MGTNKFTVGGPWDPERKRRENDLRRRRDAARRIMVVSSSTLNGSGGHPTPAAPPAPTQLVVNGDGSAGTSGWTQVDGGTLAIQNGELHVLGGRFAGIYQNVPVTTGQQYTLSVDILTVNCQFQSGPVPGTIDYANWGGIGSYTTTFTATGPSVTLYFVNGQGTTTDIACDNVSLTAV